MYSETRDPGERFKRSFERFNSIFCPTPSKGKAQKCSKSLLLSARPTRSPTFSGRFQNSRWNKGRLVWSQARSIRKDEDRFLWAQEEKTKKLRVSQREVLPFLQVILAIVLGRNRAVNYNLFFIIAWWYLIYCMIDSGNMSGVSEFCTRGKFCLTNWVFHRCGNNISATLSTPLLGEVNVINIWYDSHHASWV